MNNEKHAQINLKIHYPPKTKIFQKMANQMKVNVKKKKWRILIS